MAILYGAKGHFNMKPFRHGSRVWQYSGAICWMNTKRQVRNLQSCEAFDLSNTLVRGEALNSGPWNLASRTWKIALSYGVNIFTYDYFRFVRVHAFHGQTDRRTEVDSNSARCNWVRCTLIMEQICICNLLEVLANCVSHTVKYQHWKITDVTRNWHDM